MKTADFTCFTDEAVKLLVDDDVIAASSALLKIVAERASSNGAIAAALVMDGVALAASLANTPRELATMTTLIQQATTETLSRRLMMLAQTIHTPTETEAMAHASVTVH